MSELISNLNTIESVKTDIKSAIEAKGVSMSGVSFPDYPAAIGSITTSFVTTTLSTSVNGTFIPTAGVDGYSQVVVSVPQSVSGYTLSDVIENRIGGIRNLNDSTIKYVPIGGLNGLSYIVYDPGGATYKQKPVNERLLTVSLTNCSYVCDYGFYFQDKLSTVDLPNCVQLGKHAFDNCKVLSNVSLPKCTHVEESAFLSCRSLEEITLTKVQYIGGGCFNYAENLISITIETSSVCQLGGTLRNTPIVSGTGSIYVPASLVDAYKSARYWSSYSSRIFPIPE